jgi:hypothetical protein
MKFRAEFVDGVLLGFDGVNAEPFLSQPTWPGGDAWANAAQALEWFDVLVAALTDENALLPGDSAANHPQERLVIEESESPE